MTPPGRYAAVVLAGGEGRRLGGAGKPMLPVGGRPQLHRVLAAVADARVRVVVGPASLRLPPEVVRTQERPPGAGPVAAVVTGLALVPAGVGEVALLAADLPLLTGAAVGTLRRAVTADPALAGAVYVDGDGRPQWLCGVWRVDRLRRRLGGRSGVGEAVRDLLGPLPVARVTAAGPGPPPWWDCDTKKDRRRAERWAAPGAGG